MAVDVGEMEAAKAYGMSGALSFRRILLPQMIRHALDSLEIVAFVCLSPLFKKN